MVADPVRDEAQRLVAAAMAAFSMATRGLGRGGRRRGSASAGDRGAGVAGGDQRGNFAGGDQRANFATGSPECCVCPVCRVIAAMREPNADVADRLATGAGDLATAVTSLLRTLSRAGGGVGGDAEATREGDDFWDSLRRRARDAGSGRSGENDPWRAATTAGPPASKPMAKKTVKKASPPARDAPSPTATPAATKEGDPDEDGDRDEDGGPGEGGEERRGDEGRQEDGPAQTGGQHVSVTPLTMGADLLE